MAEQETTPEKAPEITTDYAILREQLTLLSKEFKACDPFLANIEKITEKRAFFRFLSRSIGTILEHLDIDAPDSNEVSDLEDKIEDLERDISDLEDEIEDLKDKYGKQDSLSEEYKIKFFLEYKHRYTEWELEELLKNGYQQNKLKIA
jgi:predicted  nucleic acid-binding Zn-ribbon protein